MTWYVYHVWPTGSQPLFGGGLRHRGVPTPSRDVAVATLAAVLLLYRIVGRAADGCVVEFVTDGDCIAAVA